jgi:hypothetical protein
LPIHFCEFTGRASGRTQPSAQIRLSMWTRGTASDPERPIGRGGVACLEAAVGWVEQRRSPNSNRRRPRKLVSDHRTLRDTYGEDLARGHGLESLLESHLCEFLEQGFEVVVVRDAAAGPKVPDGDGYASTLVNFGFIANGLWTTDETTAKSRARK